jgi:hypothetical protein
MTEGKTGCSLARNTKTTPEQPFWTVATALLGIKTQTR